MKFLQSTLVVLGVTTSAVTAFVAKPMSTKPMITIQSSPSPARSVQLSMSDELNQGMAEAASAEYELLGRPAREGRPLKVAIAGGGVGGLTAALCMLKKGFDVKVYERTQAFARFGGPIQFASNALSVLKEIDDVLVDRVLEKFTFTGTRACGIKDGKCLF